VLAITAAAVVGAAVVVDTTVVVDACVVSRATVVAGVAVSEPPPHPEATNRNVRATAYFLTVRVCHPSPEGAVGVSDALRVDTYSRAAGPTIEIPLRSCNKQCGILAHHSVQVAESNWPPIAGSKFP